MVAAMLAVSLLVVLFFATCLAEQKSKILVQSNMDLLHGRLTDRASILLHVNESTSALADALKLTKISSFSEVENKIAPRLFTALSTIQLASQVTYIGKDGLVFSYHRDNRTNAVLSYNFNSCLFYNQNIDQYSGERYGYPVALSFQQCPTIKGWLLNALNGHVGSAQVNNQTISFTASVGNFGVVSVGVDLKDFLRYISEAGLDQSHFSGSSGSQISVSLNNMVDSQNDPDSSYLVGFDAEVGEHLSSTQNSSMQIKIPRVITLAFPDNKTMKIFQVLEVIIICLAGVVLFGMALFTFFMLRLLKQSKIQEVILQAELIKQKEAVQQAERKSMNKSLVVARASHDVRNALHSIIGLIEYCQDQTPGSDLGTNLAKMKDYAGDLLDILNTILDNSKVESGKMRLEQAEFNISQIIEKSVDAFNILAEKKGLEMIWDPCDFSVLKLGKVTGDKQRFKQILDNLLGNAVKFTSDGKIVVRAWASKPKLKIPNISADYGLSISHMFSCLSRSTFRHFRSRTKQQDVQFMGNNPYSIELTFEVDDTGIGIPVEKRASIFENYVQVKESSPEGTGLGLGIVQSFVRLMGGEISIRDKEPGEKGSCFKFNIFLRSEEVPLPDTIRHEEPNRLTIAEPFMLNESHLMKVHSLLFVQGSETKRILQAWIESLGIKVWTAKHAEHISPTLEKINHNINSSSKSDSVLLCKTFSRKSENVENEGFLRCREKDSEPLPRAELSSEFPLRILVIVDLSNGNLSDILATLTEFIERNINLYCKIACIADSKVTEKHLSQFGALPCNLTLRKPIHGTRLHKLFNFIQEFEKTQELHVDRVATNPFPKLRINIQPREPCEITEETSSIAESKNPLSGKRILLVDDDYVIRMVGSKVLSKLGAEVVIAKNGFEALNLVKKALETGLTRGKNGDYSFTYDAIFMDCQMPVMDGYEAARQIREEERRYGIHVPIITVSADASDEDVQKAVAAGMDRHLLKPLDERKVVDFFKSVST
ncbi:histidine kinase CKI1-like protein [Carex littledalei]|uniref:histidine kinase n=1 Tax=Carex littledalei TaxID=544730 RepID=A0A833RDP5_9POAL|nr:histidine kinase CKI1-like protein [Carex littledalei]